MSRLTRHRSRVTSVVNLDTSRPTTSENVSTGSRTNRVTSAPVSLSASALAGPSDHQIMQGLGCSRKVGPRSYLQYIIEAGTSSRPRRRCVSCGRRIRGGVPAASSSRHTRSPGKFSPQRALDEPEARLGQHDEHGNPGDITDYRMSKRSEYRDSRQVIPEIDRIRPLAQPPHWAACQQ